MHLSLLSVLVAAGPEPDLVLYRSCTGSLLVLFKTETCRHRTRTNTPQVLVHKELGHGSGLSCGGSAEGLRLGLDLDGPVVLLRVWGPAESSWFWFFRDDL